MTVSPTALPDDSLASPFDWSDRPVAAPGFSALGGRFFTHLPPAPMPAGAIGEPCLVGFSPDAITLLGISRAELGIVAGLVVFTGNVVATWSSPLATVYSGHQFDVWAGQSGDGRALLLVGSRTADDPYEVQLKGAGRTSYSRMDNGRIVLRSSIRGSLCSEATTGLGIPTTRALYVTDVDAPVYREEIEAAAVVTCLTTSSVRLGRFEHFAASKQLLQLHALADHVIDRFCPASRNGPQPYLVLLRGITRRIAELMTDWQAVGFCHGTMSINNMSIFGLTLDYGPFGFLGNPDVNHVCNHSDDDGRCAYAQQSQIGYWNLFCLAQALLPLFDEDPHILVDLSGETQAQPAIDVTQNVLLTCHDVYGAALYTRYRAKPGLSTAQDADGALSGGLSKLLHNQRVDHTLLFHYLVEVHRDDTPAAAEAHTVRGFLFDRAAADVWLVAYRQRLQIGPQSDDEHAAAMYRVNPKCALRNHLAEIATRHAKEKGFSEVGNLRAMLARPSGDHPGFEHYTRPVPDWAPLLEVSYSSRCAGVDTVF